MIPISSTIWSPAARELCNHLWQSTLFALVVALLAWTLRNYSARVRYWLWMAASAKFLIPFFLLIAAGSHFARPTHATATHVAPARTNSYLAGNGYLAIEAMSQPFTATSVNRSVPDSPVAPQPASLHRRFTWPAALITLWVLGLAAILTSWLIQWRRIATLRRQAVPLHEGRVVEILRRIERRAHITRPTAVLSSKASMESGSMEPGVFGILRPVLLWPEAISPHLDDAHLETVLAHEAAHVRRRDNLTSLLHMLVEAIFWFHPLVWWMESQLVKERERACDEEVLLLCHQPQAYAESILKVCELCIESPLTCVSGITGADLKRRIGQIMTAPVARKLGVGAKLSLLAAGLAAVAAPIMLGQIKGARVIAPVKASAHAEARAVSFATRATSPIEPQSSTPQNALIASPAVREFQRKEPVELAQVEAPPAPASSPVSPPKSFDRLVQASLEGPAHDLGPGYGMVAWPVPVYPSEAKAARIQGVVALKVTIANTGTVENVQAISGPQELRQTTIDVVKQWKFDPSWDNGYSVGVKTVGVLYSLPGLVPMVGPVPPADEAAAGVKQVGGNVAAPMMIYRVDPDYTDLAKTDRVEGNVMVSLVVDEHGLPQHVQVALGLGDGLDEKAVEAVKQDRFKPAMEKDQPVTVFMYLPVAFKLN